MKLITGITFTLLGMMLTGISLLMDLGEPQTKLRILAGIVSGFALGLLVTVISKTRR